MNCPKCGLPTLSDQKFCRSCGAGLQLITQPLPMEATIAGQETTPAIIYKDERRRPDRLVLWGFIMMFIGVAIGLIGKKLLHEEIVTVVGALISIAGMFLTAYPFLLPAPRKKYGSGPSAPERVLTQSQSTKSLPPDSNTEYVSSITERTTDLLENAAATIPRKKAESSKANDSGL